MTSICTVTTLRAPLHETMMFVNYHLNIGVDHMYLFFDDPADPVVRVLAGRERITCVCCDADYWRAAAPTPDLNINERQALNTREALARARKAGMDWIVHIDSDELIFSKRRMKDLLDDCPAHLQVLKFPTMEAVVDRYHYERLFEQVSLFKVHPAVFGRELLVSPADAMLVASQKLSFRMRVLLARMLGCSISKDTYLLGHVRGKSAVRTNADLAGIDCHEPIPGRRETLRASVVKGAWLLHFECRGFAGWQQKWFDLQKARLRKPRQRLLRDFMTAYEVGSAELHALYRQWYFLSRYERLLLSRLGLMRPLRLDPRLLERQESEDHACIPRETYDARARLAPRDL